MLHVSSITSRKSIHTKGKIYAECYLFTIFFHYYLLALFNYPGSSFTFSKCYEIYHILYSTLSLYLFLQYILRNITSLQFSVSSYWCRRAFSLCDIETRTRAKVADDATRRPSVKTKPGNFDLFHRKKCRR